MSKDDLIRHLRYRIFCLTVREETPDRYYSSAEEDEARQERNRQREKEWDEETEKLLRGEE